MLARPPTVCRLLSCPRLAGKVRVIMASDLANPRLAGKGTEPRRSVARSLRYEDADGRAGTALGLAPAELDVEYVAMDGTVPPADAARIRLADMAPVVAVHFRAERQHRERVRLSGSVVDPTTNRPFPPRRVTTLGCHGRGGSTARESVFVIALPAAVAAERRSPIRFLSAARIRSPRNGPYQRQCALSSGASY